MKRWFWIFFIIMPLKAVTVTVMPYPTLQFFGSNGAPLAGGMLCTYAGGTTTPLATYTDHTGSTPNPTCASPPSPPPAAPVGIVLNAGGFANIWIQPGVSYKIVAYDINANLQWSIDGLTSAPSVPAGTDQCVQFNQSGSFGCDASNLFYNYSAHALHVLNVIAVGGVGASTIQGPLTDCGGQVFNVVCYGADPSGVADSTSAFNAAAIAAGNDGIFVPPGIFKLSATVNAGPFAPIHGAGNSNGASTSDTILSWSGTTNGPMLKESNTAGVTSSNLTARSADIGGFSMVNNNAGVATALIGVELDNITSTSINHVNAQWSGGACFLFNEQTAALFMERGSVGSDVNLSCGDGSTTGTGDLVFSNPTGTGSFGYWNIQGPHLDGHAIDLNGTGANIYHSDIRYETNMGATSVSITAAASTTMLNDRFFITGEGAGGCKFINTAASAGTVISGTGIVDIQTCTQGTIGAGSTVLIAQAGQPGDAPALQHTLGNVSGAGVTTYVASDRNDQPTVNGQPVVVSGVYSMASNSLGGDYVLLRNLVAGRGCRQLLTGTTLPGTLLGALCDYGLLFPTFNVGTSAALVQANLSSSPWSTAANGTAIYCSDCTNTATDSHVAGAACAGSGHGALAIRENGGWSCF